MYNWITALVVSLGLSGCSSLPPSGSPSDTIEDRIAQKYKISPADSAIERRDKELSAKEARLNLTRNETRRMNGENTVLKTSLNSPLVWYKWLCLAYIYCIRS